MNGSPQFGDLFIIPHVESYAGCPRLLVVEHPDGWAVPRWTHRTRHGRAGRELDDPFWPAAIQREIRQQLGIDVSVLYADLYDEIDQTTGDRRTVIGLENLSPGWSPPAGARWVGRAELDRLSLVPWMPRSALLAWLDEAASGATGVQVQAARPPWQRPGWLGAALAWIDQEVRRHGLGVTGAPVQLGTKAGRYLLRVPTDAGLLYFKALPSMYAREIGLLALLSADAHTRVPELLAMDTSRYWHLTRDHGGTPLTDAAKVGTWERVLKELGRLQVGYVGRGDDLLAAGCTDLRPETMAMQVESLLADSTALLVGLAGGLVAEELAALASLAPNLRAACLRLAAHALPPSLVHGDFLPANVGVVDGVPVFVDWCEATLSHPFFSPVRFLLSARWHGRAIRDDPDLYARLRDAYLRVWTSCAPMADSIETWELAAALQPLAYALTYWHLLHLHAADGQPVDAWERRGVVALSLRRLLDRWIRLSTAPVVLRSGSRSPSRSRCLKS